MPTTRSPGRRPLSTGASLTRPSDSCPNTSRSPPRPPLTRPGRPRPHRGPPPPGRPPAVFAGHDLAISAAHAEGDHVDQDVGLAAARLVDVAQPRAARFP